MIKKLGWAMFIFICLGGAGPKFARTADMSTQEISSHPKILSCLYRGIEPGKEGPVVPLQFINPGKKEISNILAGFRIYKLSNPNPIYSTGVTYGFAIKPGQAKNFTLFRWLPMPQEVQQALLENSDHSRVQLKLTSITYSDETNLNLD